MAAKGRIDRGVRTGASGATSSAPAPRAKEKTAENRAGAGARPGAVSSSAQVSKNVSIGRPNIHAGAPATAEAETSTLPHDSYQPLTEAPSHGQTEADAAAPAARASSAAQPSANLSVDPED